MASKTKAATRSGTPPPTDLPLRLPKHPQISGTEVLGVIVLLMMRGFTEKQIRHLLEWLESDGRTSNLALAEKELRAVVKKDPLMAFTFQDLFRAIEARGSDVTKRKRGRSEPGPNRRTAIGPGTN